MANAPIVPKTVAKVDNIVIDILLQIINAISIKTQKTIEFALSLDIEYAMFHIFEVFPGIKIWDELVQENKLDENKYWETGVRVPELPFYNKDLDFLIEIIRRTYKKFYSLARPKFIMKQFIRSIKSGYRLSKMRTLAKDYRSLFKCWIH